jgi:hypothetical protein
MSQDIWLRLKYGVKTPQPELQIAVLIRTRMFEDIVTTFDTDGHAMLGVHPAGTFEKRLRIPKMFLKEGEYRITLESGIQKALHDRYDNVLQFTVYADDLDTELKSFRRDRPGRFVFPGKWYVAT